MTPLVTLLVIGLLLVVVAVLLVWALVSPVRGIARADRAAAKQARAEARATTATRAQADADDTATTTRERAVQRSNDELRGAKATRPEPKPSVPDDAFERFLRAGRDDDR
jgi:Sec-independent protein translocase protein TatA